MGCLYCFDAQNDWNIYANAWKFRYVILILMYKIQKFKIPLNSIMVWDHTWLGATTTLACQMDLFSKASQRKESDTLVAALLKGRVDKNLIAKLYNLWMAHTFSLLLGCFVEPLKVVWHQRLMPWSLFVIKDQ